MSDDTDIDMELQGKLARVAAFEAGLRPTLLNRLLRRVGPTKPFIAVYRRIGPRIDPWLLRRTGGGITKLYGFPALVLVTTGAKSGTRRQSPLFYARDDEAFVVVGTNFGTEHHPGWTVNLLADPTAVVEVAGESIAVRAELVDKDRFEKLWPRLRAIYPGYDTYLERLTNRSPRMFLLHPVAAVA
ncbi:MAG: nitroreductase family deazaflavin-dependent oxidoreductase [Acidimicrobiia bacterium]|nr:nitroreductase family deazaflavin-dependent oxidoreductase [Acidimicrobiia bacterium]